MSRLDRILVPLDLSERSEQAVALAATLAAPFDATLVFFVNVNRPELDVLERVAAAQEIEVEAAGQLVLQRIAERLAPGIAVEFDLRHRDFPSEGILDAAAAHHADLIVIGSHGRTGVRRWVLGSVAERIARMAPIPVLIVPVRDGSDAAGDAGSVEATAATEGNLA